MSIGLQAPTRPPRGAERIAFGQRADRPGVAGYRASAVRSVPLMGERARDVANDRLRRRRVTGSRLMARPHQLAAECREAYDGRRVRKAAEPSQIAD